MKLLSRTSIAVFLGLITLWQAPLASAQSKSAQPQITFNSFTGIYHLSRDNRGLSLLTSEETIVSDFPGNGAFYGIKRVLPKKYQNHTVNIKVLNVADAAGNPVPYKTSSDSNNNLVITTGDPTIILYGSQTIKINYQTSGVINLSNKKDELLLNVNGRGWDQPFNRVDATLYIPASFKANLTGDPTCYMAINNSTTKGCLMGQQKTPQATIITSRANFVAAHQALVLKLDFKPATFAAQSSFWGKNLIKIAVFILILAGAVYLYRLKKRKPTS